MVFNTEELESLKVVDLEELKANAGNREPLIKMMIDGFRDDLATNVREKMGEIKSALEAGDAVKLKEAAHYIKGGALNACAKRMAYIAANLQSIAESGELEKAAPLVPMLEQEYATVHNWLENME